MIVNIISNMNNQVTATCRGQLTVSALLMVTMLVCKACMFSLSVDGETVNLAMTLPSVLA
jgi:hypothetical protein